MGRLLRFVVGVALILVGGAFGLRFSEQAYYSLGGTQASITLDTSACRTPRLLVFETASRCKGDWTVAGTPSRGDVIGADASSTSRTVTGRVVAGVAVLPLSGTNRLPGLLAPLLVLVGLGLALRRRRRARSSYARRRGDRDDYYSGDQHDDGGGSDDAGDSGGSD